MFACSSPDHLQPSVALIEGPHDEVISLQDCKVALGITVDEQDGLLRAALDAAVSEIDPAAGGWLGRALRPQVWELRLPGFVAPDHQSHHGPRAYARHQIVLPYPPLIEIVSVTYDDPAGVEQSLNAGDYRVRGLGSPGKQAIEPSFGGCWPVASCEAESVRIRYRAGYPPAVSDSPGPAAPDFMPAKIKQAVILATRMLLANASQNPFVSSDRVEGVGEVRYNISAAAKAAISGAIENLLATVRVY